MNIIENMEWPPQNRLSLKMQEHSAWYSGDAEMIANFYSVEVNKEFLSTPFSVTKESFWSRQIRNQSETFVHVPVANDVCETSANLLFGESPIIRIGDLKENKVQQAMTEKMLTETGFFNKIIEAAETSAAMGGVYVKVAWDKDLSEFPIPVVWQADYAIPDFKFGMLREVIFWSIVKKEKDKSIVYRLLETYKKGSITLSLFKGSEERLGKEIDLFAIEETQGMEKVIDTDDLLLAVYVPNVLPNKMDRTSYLGRSDLLGIEGLMDSLDEIYTNWCREITLAQAKVLIPESYMKHMKDGGKRFNPDRTVYVELDIDPVNEKQNITPQQFEIRADEFEKSALNFLERIVTSAGYSPQSFGLSISGRAESGTALHLRERKTFSTKAKKEKYWEAAIKHLVFCMSFVYQKFLSGKDVDLNLDRNVSFSDGVMNDVSEISKALTEIQTAVAASIDTKVRMLHADWDEDKIQQEVERIKEEHMVGEGPPMDNPDLDQINFANDDEGKGEDNADEQ